MVNFKKLGFEHMDEYNNEFVDTLLETNRTYNFFVDWEKVFSKLEDNIIEINILNSLKRISNDKIEDKFKEIINNYPECVPLLPLIVAVRDNNIAIFDIDTNVSKNINFSETSFNQEEIVKFSKETGLLNLFSEIDDLYSYLTGTEVGLDTNARKNRSGHIFEDIVGNFLNEIIKEKPEYTIDNEVSGIVIDRKKRFDFVIYKNKSPKFLFECNFYNSTGSKPIETAHAYVDLQEQIRNTNMTFIWVTDGLGWKKMFSTLKSSSKNIDYILNYFMLKNKINLLL
ncbi:type II restriction endonuclease [Methanobrevibacter filiformis]|uniref:Type-2 restriction enzyme n=1 Tax=Methanobrevibacter filiformis TaxID=55758 RepID=A0A166EN75_9EURY|nr:type II restriction endonuclease [Methanobrevibacter filiformis]KZX16835.1 type-2 restriction enzyme DpnII [Methanobrevibacter filiformis]